MEGAAEELVRGARISPTLTLVEPLSSGGMADVWIAEDSARNARVAVKFIAPELANEPSVGERFRREAAAAGQLENDHVVRQFASAKTERGTAYIAMELLAGEDLYTRLAREKKLAPHVALAIVQQLAVALQAAHDRGIIHRDVKPENVYLCAREHGGVHVKVLDFGLAKVRDQLGLTKTGTVVGTPHYMSPEQMMGAKDMDHGVDIWATGVLAFQMLTGRLPFDAKSTQQMALALANAPIPNPTEFAPELPKELDAWFQRACSRDRKQRFQSARELADSLTAILDPRRPSYAPLVFAALAGVLVASIVIWFLRG